MVTLFSDTVSIVPSEIVSKAPSDDSCFIFGRHLLAKRVASVRLMVPMLEESRYNKGRHRRHDAVLLCSRFRFLSHLDRHFFRRESRESSKKAKHPLLAGLQPVGTTTTMSSWTNATLAEYWKRNFPLRIDLLDILKVVAATAAAIFGLALLHRMLYRFLKNAAVRISQFFRRAPTKLGSGKGDPFAVLGLERGKEKTTIVDAVKARRKLALKYHPGEWYCRVEEGRYYSSITHYIFMTILATQIVILTMPKRPRRKCR